jgi:hypothetical protein
MVEKLITSPENVIDFSRYLAVRNGTVRAPAISTRACRYCGATLSEGENEDECSSTFNTEAPRVRGPRMYFAE